MCIGFYRLDLADERDRHCLALLIQRHEVIKAVAQSSSLGRGGGDSGGGSSPLGFGRLGDLSQRGDWSSFRNCVFDGQEMNIKTSFYSPSSREHLCVLVCVYVCE